MSCSVDDIDAEVNALEAQLERARQKKLELERKTRPETDAERLQREIDEIKRQLQEDDCIQLPQTEPPPELLSVNDRPPSMPNRKASTDAGDVYAESPQHQSRPVISVKEERREPSPQRKAKSPVRVTREPAQVPKQETKQIAQPIPEPVRGASEQTKQLHSWAKPSWALPSEAIPDVSIQKESIQNPLLKQPKQGYERKVQAKDLELIKGKFVQHKEKKPDPRLVWIVVNIDGSKVGKIVMHLYGNVLPITDIFLELKGLELKRGKDAQTYFVDDIDPCFYVYSGNANQFRGPSSACYGIVIEGKEVVEKLVAASTDSVFTIKQSHIYPVKKAK